MAGLQVKTILRPPRVVNLLIRLRDAFSNGDVSGCARDSDSTHPNYPAQHLAIIGGHLAFRAAFDPRVLSSVCFFATDIHSATLGKGKQDDSLAKVRAGELTNNGELIVSFMIKSAFI